MKNLLEVFSNIKVRRTNNQYATHKPLLLLVSLGRCYQGKNRLELFSVYDNLVGLLSNEKIQTNYAFNRLLNDGIWEVDNHASLYKTSSGDLLKGELISKKIKGGLTKEVYQILINDKDLLMKIVDQILQKFFPKEQHAHIRTIVDLPQPVVPSSEVVEDFSGSYQKNKWDLNEIDEDESKRVKINNFIAYLNSLHNLEASGANALAESQALNRYFTELYEPFPLIEDVFKVLVSDEEKVVVITGHAGDGKSTVALDILKRLRRLPLNQPLNQPLEELEEVQWPNHSGYKKICIVKDMSELTAKRRLQWIQQGFNQPGTWLIISNTGPLLNTLKEWSQQAGDIESEILEGLDQPYTGGDLSLHTLNKKFPKPLVIVNMTRLDNVILGSRLLTRMVSHPAWQQCTGCSAEVACPLLLNQQALQAAASTVEERVRWIYQRLTAYEQRLTMRQMIAHLALSLTGGMTCHQAKEPVALSTVEGAQALAGLEDIVFSEGFFGYRKGKPWPAAENLRAIALVRRLVFGGPIAVDFERQLLDGAGTASWTQLPATLSPLNEHWRSRIGEATGVRWRFAQRRMIYMFGKKIDGADAREELFLDSFLQSPRLRDFDQWQRYGAFGTFDAMQQHRFCKACLRVLLEVFSGFSAGQFQSDQDRLYLTLRRPDRAVAQPTQLVIAMLPFEDFDLHYDSVHRLPLLRFQLGKINLALSLPLLDYIQRRDTGELGSDLARIHLAQLERFRAELLQTTKNNYQKPGEIRLLRADIDGRVHLHRYFLDEKNQRLEHG